MILWVLRMGFYKKLQNFIGVLFFVCLLLFMLTDSKHALELASQGLLVWFHTMIPTLFPFMILSGILIRTGLSEKIATLFEPILGKVYRLSPNCVYIILMGFLCGFPMGAALITESLSFQRITKEEGKLLLAFCTNIGPVYFIGYVLKNCPTKNPIASICLMYFIPFFYGLFLRHTIFRNTIPYCDKKRSKQVLSIPFLEALEQSLNKGIESITKLGGYMILFNVMNLFLRNRYFCLPYAFQLILGCLLEISGGIHVLSNDSMFYPIAYVLLPFGGLCCIAQTFSMIRESGLHIQNYVYHKVIQSVLTAIFVFVFFS